MQYLQGENSRTWPPLRDACSDFVACFDDEGAFAFFYQMGGSGQTDGAGSDDDDGERISTCHGGFLG